MGTLFLSASVAGKGGWLSPTGAALAGDLLLVSLLLEASLSLSVGALCLQEERLLALLEILESRGGRNSCDALSEGRATCQRLVFLVSVPRWIPQSECICSD